MYSTTQSNGTNDELMEIYGTIESVEEGCEKFYVEMEGAARCQRGNFNHDTFNTNSITKKTAARFLLCCSNIIGTKTGIINQLCCVVDKLVYENNQLKEGSSSLKTSLIQSQDSVIGLQSELLECKTKQLQSVQSVVQNAVKSSVKSEIKSYSDAVSSVHKANVPVTKSLSQAVRQVVQAEDRSRNFVVFGLKEEPGVDTGKQIDEVLEFLGEKPRHESVRIGTKKESDSGRPVPRPVKVSVASSAHVFQILRAAKKLKDSEQFGNVFICPDRTVEERTTRREAVTSLKQKMKDEPGKRHIIRGGKVLTVSTTP